jgi:short-subunit dehydrogenase
MGQRRSLKGMRVLVTGASQGIGQALVESALKRDMRVVAVARSLDLLRKLADEAGARRPALLTLQADVTSPTDRQKMVETVRRELAGLDVLINNAGIGATGHFIDSSPEVLRQIFETNFFGAAEVTRAFLPMLAEGTKPALVNIGSILGKRAFPARGLYSASKFALQGLSEALRPELVRFGIDVLVVNPGLTQTNFSQNMLERKGKLALDHLRGMTPTAVAEATMVSLERGRDDVNLTLQGRLLLLVNRLAPWVVDFFTRRKVRQLFADEIAARQGKAPAAREVAPPPDRQPPTKTGGTPASV